ncbi:MAG: AAA family ATPase, partial [Candidatus Omnitrophota bacterium]|nr:AAA family ATPase [Candidatus Omnitrophota bacterium]
MAYIIAVTGKGGVGKTTISAMLVYHLLKIDKPILAVDADPNSNLNVALGLKYEETIADIREEVKKQTPESFSKSEFFGMRLEEAMVEGNGFDLLVMGRPEGPGCYCAVNNILREYLAKISKKYKFVVIDNEAGMEHLSRRTAADVDLLLLVSDPTMVGINSAINAFNTAKNAGIKIKDITLVINKSKGGLDSDKLKLIEEAGLKIG